MSSTLSLPASSNHMQALTDKLGFNLPDTGVLNPKDFLGVQLTSLVLIMAVGDSDDNKVPTESAPAQATGVQTAPISVHATES